MHFLTLLCAHHFDISYVFFVISTSPSSIPSSFFTERHYDGYQKEFYSDTPPFDYLNFEDNNPQPRTHHRGTAFPTQPHLPVYRNQYKHGPVRNGKCLLVDNILTRSTRSINCRQYTGSISLAFDVIVMSLIDLVSDVNSTYKDGCFCAAMFSPESIYMSFMFCRFCLQSSTSL